MILFVWKGQGFNVLQTFGIPRLWLQASVQFETSDSIRASDTDA